MRLTDCPTVLDAFWNAVLELLVKSSDQVIPVLGSTPVLIVNNLASQSVREFEGEDADGQTGQLLLPGKDVYQDITLSVRSYCH